MDINRWLPWNTRDAMEPATKEGHRCLCKPWVLAVWTPSGGSECVCPPSPKAKPKKGFLISQEKFVEGSSRGKMEVSREHAVKAKTGDPAASNSREGWPWFPPPKGQVWNCIPLGGSLVLPGAPSAGGFGECSSWLSALSWQGLLMQTKSYSALVEQGSVW